MDEADAHKRKRDTSGSFVSKKQALLNQDNYEQTPFSVSLLI
jgi:hypothetical protein